MDTTKIKQEAEEKMEMTIEFLDETFSRIRAGRANPRILDGIRVEYYGSIVPLSNVATVTTPDAKTILVQPWETCLRAATLRSVSMNHNRGYGKTSLGAARRFGNVFRL